MIQGKRKHTRNNELSLICPMLVSLFDVSRSYEAIITRLSRNG